MIEFNCTHCGMLLKVQDEAGGKRGKCPKCGTALTVPDADFVILQAVDQPTHASQPHKPSTNPQPSHAHRTVQSSTGRKHRRWVIALIIAAIISMPFAPAFPHWLGIILLCLCAMALIPKLRAVPQSLLKLPRDRNWASGMRVVIYACVGLMLILGSSAGADFKAEWDRIAALKAAEEAEEQRLIAEANETLASLTREAEQHWNNGKLSLAEAKLQAAETTPRATNLTPVNQLRSRIANAQLADLMKEAKEAVNNADFSLAQQKIQAALAIPNATALDEPTELQNQIANATDLERTKAALMSLSDEAFDTFYEDRKLPAALLSGYDILEQHTLQLAQSGADEVALARDVQRQEREAQIERQRQEREARILAAAEAKERAARKERIDKGFSAWDGSHRELTVLIKASMNDPDSYKHDTTTWSDYGDYLIVHTTFRGKNGFGGVVRERVKAKVDLDGHVIEIIAQGP